MPLRCALVLLINLGCGTQPEPESSSGDEEVPSYAVWKLQTRIRLPESDAWIELDPATSSTPFASEVVVSGGHHIGELGRWVGCDLSVSGATADDLVYGADHAQHCRDERELSHGGLDATLRSRRSRRWRARDSRGVHDPMMRVLLVLVFLRVRL